MGLALNPSQKGGRAGEAAPDVKADSRRTEGKTSRGRTSPLNQPEESKPPLGAKTAPVGQAGQPPVTPDEPGKPANLVPPLDEKMAADLEAQLGKRGKTKIKTGELNAFWESASKSARSAGKLNPDAIPYDEARRMGLAPEDTEEPK